VCVEFVFVMCSFCVEFVLSLCSFWVRFVLSDQRCHEGFI